jgi:plasmid rolling circle replication initiator protein Rep
MSDSNRRASYSMRALPDPKIMLLFIKIKIKIKCKYHSNFKHEIRCIKFGNIKQPETNYIFMTNISTR